MSRACPIYRRRPGHRGSKRGQHDVRSQFSCCVVGEAIMSKTNDNSKPRHDLGGVGRQLRSDELEHVSGGSDGITGDVQSKKHGSLDVSKMLMGGYKTAAAEGWGN